MHSDAIRAALAAALLVAPGAASALTIYENDFETGDITDFVLTEATVATGLSADFIAVDSPAIGDGALRVALTKQQNTGNDLNPIARVTAEIFVPVAASDYVLDISARTSVCNGCIVGAVAKHLGIAGRVGAEASVIHAYGGHAVVENALSLPWRRRIVGRFAFPAPETDLSKTAASKECSTWRR